MITPKMKKFLETEYLELREKKGSVKLHVYLDRIQRRIERELKMLLWLAINRPDILLSRIEWIDKYGHTRIASEDKSHERLKMLMLAIKALMEKENLNVELTKNEADN